MRRLGYYLAVILGTLWVACVDKVDLSLPASELPVIVEGRITDQPGPDTVRISKAYPADGQYHPREGVEGAKVSITDDAGLVDNLIDIGMGNYVTNLLNGVTGRTYQLSVLFLDTIDKVPTPTLVMSSPQRMMPAGTIDSIFYEFTSGINTSTGLSEDGFNVYVNSSLSPGSSGRIQWHFFGTYTVMTDPSAILIPIPCADPPCPVEPLACADNCVCCVCWYTTFEKAPIISSPTVLGGSKLNRMFMQYIPINSNTFFERYRVEIKQFEVSEDVFEFYQAIRKQIDNSNSIFQPPFFELKGNVEVKSGPRAVIGIFSASALTTKNIYIPRSAVPYGLSTSLLPGDCRAVADNATITKPAYWE